MRKPIYHDNKHFKYLSQYYEKKKVARKTKKHLKRLIKEKYLLSEEEVRWLNLPDCKYCTFGTVRDHPNDSGYRCPDCYGTGKQGWSFSSSGKKVEKATGFIVKE